MKKLLIAAAIFTGVACTASAQQKAVVTKPAAKMEVVKKTTPAKVVTVTKAAPATPAVKTTTSVKSTSTVKATPAVVLKADGTPDKRYKAKAATGPLKKDGTADMRYKANKGKKGN